MARAPVEQPGRCARLTPQEKQFIQRGDPWIPSTTGSSPDSTAKIFVPGVPSGSLSCRDISDLSIVKCASTMTNIGNKQMVRDTAELPVSPGFAKATRYFTGDARRRKYHDMA